MKIVDVEVGDRLNAEAAGRLASISAERYEALIRQVKRSTLAYESEELLEHHWEKHAGEFEDLGGPEAYQREARQLVRESNRVLAHISESRGVQFRFFGARGFAVVNAEESTLAGYFGHSNIDKAFQGLRRKNVWLKRSEND